MKIHSLRIFMSLAVVCGAVAAEEKRATGPEPKQAFVFRGVGYFHRWSGNEQHEFTPAKQEDLEKWSDMMTVNGYPDAGDGDRLAATANAVLENYQNNQGKVIKTSSLPRTADRPAEHSITAVFTRPDFVEAAFARFKLLDGEGCSAVYSHRIYGEKAGDKMDAWLSANGEKVENALMEWNSIPSPSSLR